MTEKKLQKIKLKYLKRNIEIHQEHQELLLLYQNYINNIIELFDYLKLPQNKLMPAIVFDILVEIGYFSSKNSFDSDQVNFKELTIKPGISVVSGAGVCRNIACFYEDIFKTFYDYPITACFLDKFGNNDNDTKIYGNHMINLVIHNDIVYGFDIMNHCLFKVIERNKLKGIDINYNLIYKPYGDLLIRLATTLEQKQNFIQEIEIKQLLFEIASRHTPLSSDDYNDQINKANEFIMARKAIFQSFMMHNRELTDEIKRKMLSLK